MNSKYFILVISIIINLLFFNNVFAETENGTTNTQDNGTIETIPPSTMTTVQEQTATELQDNGATGIQDNMTETPGPMIITPQATTTQSQTEQELPESDQTQNQQQETEPINNQVQNSLTTQNTNNEENKIAKNDCNGINNCRGCSKELVKTFCCISSKNKTNHYATGCED